MDNSLAQLNSCRFVTAQRQMNDESPAPLSGSLTGYLHPLYAESLREFGDPLELPRSGGHLLVRRIPGTDLRDAMGPYPLFCCRDWKGLAEDLHGLRKELVSVCVVTNPFGDYDQHLLREAFQTVIHFKDHFIADLGQPLNSFVSSQHRYNVRKALREVAVEVCHDPLRHLEEWTEIYGHLIQRHGITGLRRFSKESFAKQLVVPGMLMFRAVRAGEPVGFNLIYLQRGVAYAHLSAESPLGYKLRASYALRFVALQHLLGKVSWVNLGAVAGLTANLDDGLTHFKRGWASGTKPAFFCGTIFDQTAYERLANAAPRTHPGYFPAYRDGEFDFDTPSEGAMPGVEERPEAPLTSAKSAGNESVVLDMQHPQICAGAQAEAPAEKHPAATGYLHPLYADSLREFGEPVELPHCGGWVLKREIPGCAAFDAMGCYPLFACRDWRRLGEDLRDLEGSLVSVTLVTDAFGNYEPEELKAWFDVAFHFKDHYICDLAGNPDQFVSKHHRRYAKKALEHARVEVVDDPVSYLDEWTELYAVLVRRHSLTGIKAFSKDCFRKQLSMPDLVMMKIVRGATTLGALLWFIKDGVAYAHLMALSDEGYAANAFYGLFWRSIEIFKKDLASRISFLHLGGGSGASAGEADGMLFFKKGWSTAIRQAWLCGKILDRDKYAALVEAKHTAPDPYFPLYRKGEF